MGIRDRKKHSRRVNVTIAIMLTVFALLTYLITFLIFHLWREG